MRVRDREQWFGGFEVAMILWVAGGGVVVDAGGLQEGSLKRVALEEGETLV